VLKTSVLPSLLLSLSLTLVSLKLPKSIFTIQNEYPMWAQDDDESMMGLESISDPEEQEHEESESDIEQGWVDSRVEDKGSDTPLAGSTVVVGGDTLTNDKKEKKKKEKKKRDEVVVPSSSASSCSSAQPMFCSSSSSSSSSSSCLQQGGGEGESDYQFPFPGSSTQGTTTTCEEEEEGEEGWEDGQQMMLPRGRYESMSASVNTSGGGRRRMFMGKARDGGRTRSGGVKGIGIFLKEG